MIVYIDANKYLQFLRDAGEEFTSLSLLAKHMKKEKITLLFPQITQDEFYRNVDKVQLSYIGSLLPFKVDLPNQSSLNKDQKLRSKINKHISAINQEINKLKAVHLKKSEDLIKQVEKLASLAVTPEVDDELFTRAKRRRFLGNPPGKSDSKFHIGDEIVWEIILRDHRDDDVVIISNDGDWASISAKSSEPQISTFLYREWERKSKKTLRLETNIGRFINNNFKVSEQKVSEDEIQKENEIEKSFVVNSRRPDIGDTSLALSWSNQAWGEPTIGGSYIQNTRLRSSSFISNPGEVFLSPSSDTQPLLLSWTCQYCNRSNPSSQSGCVCGGGLSLRV